MEIKSIKITNMRCFRASRNTQFKSAPHKSPGALSDWARDQEPCKFDKIGIHWISVRNQSFHQRMQLTEGRWSILFCWKYILLYGDTCYLILRRGLEMGKVGWGGGCGKVAQETGPKTFYFSGAFPRPMKLLPLALSFSFVEHRELPEFVWDLHCISICMCIHSRIRTCICICISGCISVCK